MATLNAFRALRPNPDEAARVAAVPYDVVSTDEARALAEGNPLSFLRVSRAELELPPGTDPHSDAVYDRAVRNLSRLRASTLVVEARPALYFYRLSIEGQEQTGLAGCWSLDEYDADIIRKHERTRRDKEDDRTRHMIALGAQTGPAFLIYRAVAGIDEAARMLTAGEPLFDFDAADGVHHTLWRVAGEALDDLAAAFSRVPALYIADGHHRVASAARTRDHFRRAGAERSSPADRADASTFLGVAFPHDQVRILPYNRIVKDLGSLSHESLFQGIGDRFEFQDGPAVPARRGDISMYVGNRWRVLRPRSMPNASNVIRSLDVSILQEELLAPVLGITDVTTDKRIEFVGGARGTAELESVVNSGKAALAFSLFPVSVSDLMAVADAGSIMPPKSTWFEPKLRDGLLSHLI